MWTQIRLLLQEQPDLDLDWLSKRLRIFQQTTKGILLFVIYALRVNKEFNVYTVRVFYEIHARLHGSDK